MTADYERWQQLDFVVGIRIELSNNHTLNDKKFRDICDELSEPLDGRSVNRVDDVPQEFTDWVRGNSERIEHAKSLSYFVKDNKDVVEEILNPKQKVLTTLEKAKLRHDARTPEQIEAIKNRWAIRNALRKNFVTEKDVDDTFKVINENIVEKWFVNGNLKLSSTANRYVSGYTYMDGRISLASDRLQRVKSALTKIGQSKSDTITELEADAMATSWHEVTHNRNVHGNMHLTEMQTRFMELANEFVARKTLPEFYHVLGCKETPYPQFISNRISTGYNDMVNSYDFVIKRLGLDFDKVLEAVRRNLFNEVYSDQKTGLKNGLINGGIKRLDGKKIKRSELNELLSVIRENSQTTVENWLRINGYLK